MTLLLAAGRPTFPDVIVFVLCAVVILAGAVGVVTSRNPVHAALSLVATLFGVAVLFIEQEADFLAAVQVIVYAGAIVVLFLFVIMFLGVDRQEDVSLEPLRGQRPLAFLLIAATLGLVIAMAASAHWVTGAHAVSGSTSAGHHTNVYLLGKSVFTTYLWAFEITAGLLVIAVVGAVVLARRPPHGSGEEASGRRSPGQDASDAGGSGPGSSIDAAAGPATGQASDSPLPAAVPAVPEEVGG
jgi:NADH-quinone oxidoreductase subunit J